MTMHIPSPAHREQVGVVEAFADHCALDENGLRPLRVSSPHLRKGVPGARPGLFCALATAFEYASTAREPSQPRRGLASEHQTRPDQEGVPGGTLRIVTTDGFTVGTRPRERGFLLMAGQVRRECELLEIVQTERRSGVRRRELRVRVAP
jgi:hypothetical protein